MAEESGILIIKGDAELAEVFAEYNGQLKAAMGRFAAVSGLNSETLFEKQSAVERIKVKDHYVHIVYDCAHWVSFSTYVVNESSGIEYYAYHHNEYGTIWLFSVVDGDRLSTRIDVDIDDIDDSMRDEIGHWVSNLPAEVTDLFPDINPFESEEF